MSIRMKMEVHWGEFKENKLINLLKNGCIK